MRENTQQSWMMPLGAVLSLLAVGLLFLMGATLPQNPPSITLDELQQQLGTLREDVAANDAEITEIRTILLDKADESELERVATQTSQLADEVVQLQAQVRALDRKVSDDIDPLVQEHKTILEQIARTSGNDIYVPNIEANMARDGFREEMQRVVNGSIDGSSRIMITNKTPTTQTVSVNETSYRVAPGQTQSIDVPTGNVSTRLAGQDVVNWAVGPPRYNQRLQIVNRPGAITYLCPWPY